MILRLCIVVGMQARAVFALLLLSVPGVAQSAAAIHIDAARVESHISPRMVAAFAEIMAEDVKRGLTAEMLLDRSFDEPADFLGLPAHWQIEPDERNDNVNAIRFAPTTEEAYPGTNSATHAKERSLRVTLAPGDITDARRGFSQGRLSVRQGMTYNGTVWAKLAAKNAYAGPVTVALEEDVTDGATYARTTLAAITGEGWHKYSFSLTPTRTDRFAKLTLLFGGRGTVYLDQLSLEPADARGEVRADVEAMIRELHPSFLRWPGGNVAQDYHWQWGIGPRDQRPVWVNKAWSNAPEPNDFGTDEYLALCERAGIEPSLTVNVEGAGETAEEAAHWVEYVNGPATSTFGAMRAANGHPAPYHVRQWELGNEIFGAWVSGHVTAEVYAQSAVRYARAMRAVDPSLQLIAVGEGAMKDQDDWNSTVLRIAGPEINFLAIHDYTSSNENTSRAQMLGRAAKFEAGYRHTADLIRQLAPGRNIRQIVNEWNLFYDASVIQGREGAVYASRMMNGFERSGDTVESQCISDLLNGWVGGIIQASRDRVYGTAQFYVEEMYARALGSDRLHADVASPELGPDVSAVDAVAERSSDGRKLFLKLSNADPTRAMPVNFSVTGFAHAPAAHLAVLAAQDVTTRNSFSDPKALIPAERTLRCPPSGACHVELPPDAVAVITLTSSATR